VTIGRQFYGQVWLEHFCPKCLEAAEASYQEQLKNSAEGFDELPEEANLPDSASGESQSGCMPAKEMKAKFRAMFAEAAKRTEPLKATEWLKSQPDESTTGCGPETKEDTRHGH
jgi:hypothetical protein